MLLQRLMTRSVELQLLVETESHNWDKVENGTSKKKNKHKTNRKFIALRRLTKLLIN